MRRLLILTLPALLTVACDSGGDDDGGGDRNSGILALSGDATAGETLFNDKGCSIDSCHGADGNSGTTAPALNGVVSTRSDSQLIDSVLDGTDGGMPAQNLTDQEMADVLAYLNANFG